MSADLWLPPGVECPHLESSLMGSFVPNLETGEHLLSIICRACGSAWDQTTIPLDVLATVIDMLEQGRTTRIDIPPGT
jgi:hypothetical protein